MADTPASAIWKLAQGIIILSILAFVALLMAGLGWHVGVALARVLGL